MRLSTFLLCLLLTGCMPKPPDTKQPALQVPAPASPVLKAVDDTSVEDAFQQALESFRTQHKTTALQAAAKQFPDSLYAHFAEQLLQLDAEIAKSESSYSKTKKQRQRCLREKEQLTLQLKKLQEQMERLTRSMLEQEKRNP